MNSTQQRFFQNQPRHFGVVLLFQIRKRGQDAMRLAGQAHMNRLEGFAHSLHKIERGIKNPDTVSSAGQSDRQGGESRSVNAENVEVAEPAFGLPVEGAVGGTAIVGGRGKC